MKIGVIVATNLELKAFLEVFGEPDTMVSTRGGQEIKTWLFDDGDLFYLSRSGIGEIAAASATQYLIDHFRVDGIINYGVVGALTEEHVEQCVGIVEKVVHYDFDVSFGSSYQIGEYPDLGIYLEPVGSVISESEVSDLPKFVCASADKIVGGGEPKRRLHRNFGADICEMEAAGVLITCNRNNVPCTMIKAISDGVDGDVEAFEQHAYLAAKRCVEIIKKNLSQEDAPA